MQSEGKGGEIRKDFLFSWYKKNILFDEVCIELICYPQFNPKIFPTSREIPFRAATGIKTKSEITKNLACLNFLAPAHLSRF